MASNTEFITYQVQVNTKSGEVNIDNITKGFEKADRAFNKLQKDMSNQLPNLNKKIDGTTAATGGATASIMELGRVISDAPYGIRGMGNNLSQLASNLVFTGKKAGGFVAALGALSKALFSPLGVLLAIQTAIAFFEKMAISQQKAGKATGDFTNLVDKQAAKLLILNQILLGSNISLDEKKGIVKDVNQEFKGLNISLDKNGRLTKASQKALDKLTASMVKNAKAQAVLKKITDEQSKIVEIELERSKRIAEAGVGAFEGTLEDLEKQRQKYIERYQKQIDYNNLTEQEKQDAMNSYMNTSTMQRFDALKNFRKKDLEDAEKNISDMVKLVTDEKLYEDFYGKEDPFSPVKDPKEFKKEAEDYVKQLRDLDKKREIQNAKSEIEKIQIQRKYHIADLNRKHEENKEKFEQEAEDYKKRLKLFLDFQVKTGKMTQSDADKELSDFDKNIKSQLDLMDENFPKLLMKWETYYSDAQKLAAISKIGLFKKPKDGDEDEYSLELARIEAFVSRYMEISGTLTNFLNANFDRQLTIEQNKTNALNNELRERLNNENLSADERKEIQLKISRNDELLRKKQDQIRRKQFNMNKAANIANALVNTYSGASKAYFNTLSNPANKLLPDGGLVRAKINAGIATAVGLINVAAIAKQKFQSSISSAPSAGALGGGGGEQASRSFNFNLAGSTGENQLAQTLQGRFDQPLQAYVVSRDITNAQQLQEDIQNNASFG